MLYWLKIAGNFLKDWACLTVVGGGMVAWIVKAAIFSSTLTYALSDSTKLDIHFLTKVDEGISEMTFIWQPTMGLAVFLSVLVAWLAIAAGITWERRRRFMLRLADVIEPTEEGAYWLTVFNDGHGEAMVRIFVSEAIFVYLRGNEEITESILPHCVEILWADYMDSATFLVVMTQLQ